MNDLVSRWWWVRTPVPETVVLGSDVRVSLLSNGAVLCNTSVPTR